MLTPFEVFAPIRVFAPRQRFAREEDGEQSACFSDEAAHELVEFVLIETLASAAFVEDPLILIDKQHKAIIRVIREVKIQILREHPWHQVRQHICILQFAVFVELLQICASMV